MKTHLMRLVTTVCSLFMFCTVAFAYEHTVMLRVVKVTPDWIPYASTDGWTQSVSVKESNKLKYFEVAIWEETSSVHLYEFPNDYDPFYGQGKTDQEKIDYREQFALKVFSNMPIERNAKSGFLKSAFLSFLNIITVRYPQSSHALSYSGHGGPGGALFAGVLAPKHSQDILSYWANKIQSKLAFIDMGGPCNKGGYNDLNAFCPFTEYYIASDLPNGGYTMDDWTIEKYNETNPDYRYHDLIANNNTLLQVLEKRIALKRKAYEYSRVNMIQNKIEQANYLYSCESFKKLYDKVEPIKSSFQSYSDLRNILVGYGNSYVTAFDSTLARKANNRDFFSWELIANGMLTLNSLGFSQELENLSYPILIFPPNNKSSIVPILLPLLLN